MNICPDFSQVYIKNWGYPRYGLRLDTRYGCVIFETNPNAPLGLVFDSFPKHI